MRDALTGAEMPIESSGVTMVPSSTVSVSGKDAAKVLNLVESLDDHDDVQKVHANFDIPDEELAALGQ